MADASGTNMVRNNAGVDLIRELAERYIWWREDEAPEADRVVAQVMNIGDFSDVLRIEKCFGRESLVRVLQGASPGVFSPKSWTFWHYRLGLACGGEAVPPLKMRRF